MYLAEFWARHTLGPQQQLCFYVCQAHHALAPGRLLLLLLLRHQVALQRQRHLSGLLCMRM